jgi:RND family efflux transporter MFP subunit
MKIFFLPYARRLLISFLAILLAITTLSACEGDHTDTLSREAKTWQSPVITVREETLADEYTTIGSIVADRNINISSRVSSYISQLAVQEGESIRVGQLLIVLDNEELDNQINQARAAVSAARAVLTDVSSDLTRFNNLLEQGSISAVKVRKTQLQKATATENLKAAKAALSLAESQGQYTRILSPTAGIVTRRHLQVGSLTTPGMPLLTIESRDKLKFETYVAESQLANINIDDTVKLEIDNIAEPLMGKITQIIYAGDPVTRSYKVSIALPIKTESIRAEPGKPVPGKRQSGKADFYTGMFGRATFVVGHSDNITIPDSALIEKGGLPGVYVIDADNKVAFRWLRIRREWPDRMEVAAGLGAGERIAAVVPANIREGDLIQAQQADSNSDTEQDPSQ